MTRSLRILAAILVTQLAMASGCVYSPTGPGIVYMNVKGPLSSSVGTRTLKQGKSCQLVIAALFALGDASVETAKVEGGISEVTSIDHESFNVLGFGSFCTVVTGS